MFPPRFPQTGPPAIDIIDGKCYGQAAPPGTEPLIFRTGGAFPGPMIFMHTMPGHVDGRSDCWSTRENFGGVWRCPCGWVIFDDRKPR